MTIVAALAGVGLGACSGTAPGSPTIGQPAATGVAGGTAPASQQSGAPGAAAIDPCMVLHIPDVQPFFSVAVATQSPGVLPGSCEWSTNDAPGGVSTSMQMYVATGQDALDQRNLADGPGPDTASRVSAIRLSTIQAAPTSFRSRAPFCAR